MILTRRQAIQIAGAGLLLPPAANAHRGKGGINPGQSFDFYVSPTGTGSASTGGTFGNPWPISMLSNATAQARYAGKRVGLLPGTYDVSALMGTNESVAALTIIGGSGPTAQTYIGSSDGSGFYSPRTATLDAMGSTGFFGGNNANTSAVMAARAGATYWVVDGLRFTGYSMWCFHVGNSPSGGANAASWFIQNCEFTGGNCSFASNATFANGVNCGVIIIYASTNGTVTNNWFHDNVGNSRDTQHWSCIYQWGLGGPSATGPTSGTLVSLNTIVNSGNLQFKEATQYNSEIAYNYIDMTVTLSTSEYTGSPIFGGMSDGGSASATGTKWHHNVLLANDIALDFNNTNPSSSYLNSPLYIYNNTVVIAGKQADGYVNGGYDVSGTGQGSAGHLNSWNNLYYDNGQTPAQYGYWLTNTDAFALCDYNIYGAWNKFLTVPAGQNGSTGATTHASLASWGSAIGGLEAHSATSGANPFVGTGLYAARYQLASGALPLNFGRVGGVSGGAVVNAGAWDGTVTQIGCNFAV